jgi:hypothetical protein
MENVRSVDRGFFPLDEELKLVPGGLTPYGCECLVRLGGWMPFGKAVELLADFMGIRISESQGRRYAEEAGAAYVKMQTAEVEQIEKKAPEAPKGAEKIQISADGAMVPLLHGQWGEVRTVVVGEVQPAVKEKEDWVVHTRNLSYFSRKVSAEEFGRLALVEMQRRGVENAKEVGAVMDGAEWEQGFIDYHCPNAVRILDFPHAGEHISPIGDYIHGEHTPEGKEWLQKRLHQLKQEGPADLLAEIRHLQEVHPDAQVISSNLAYMEKRQAQMQYPTFRAQGWPIGSGIVESGNKLVVEARLKGAGMHWADGNVDPMLALRNILCSDRWKQEWPKIEDQLRQQNSLRRLQNHQSRSTPDTPIETPSPQPITDVSQDQKPQVLPKTPKENPWRKFKFGRALYQRPKTPKN